MDLSALPTWEYLQKRMTWDQLGQVRGRRVRDFGCGNGATAAHLAALGNEVVAADPAPPPPGERFSGDVLSLEGSLEALEGLEDFDLILCHNVLEYVEDKPTLVRALADRLKSGGTLSLVKHNRPGRVMQMAVLLNAFDRAKALLDGADDGQAEAYGAIRYYEDGDVTRWATELRLEKTLGQRTFWDLQQNQDIQRDSRWREEMLELEHRVSQRSEYRSIAFFHHLFFVKNPNSL